MCREPLKRNHREDGTVKEFLVESFKSLDDLAHVDFSGDDRPGEIITARQFFLSRRPTLGHLTSQT
jgi:hypothetical protein